MPSCLVRQGSALTMQVVLLFPHQFWPKGTDMFGHIAETTEERGDFFLFYSYAELAGTVLLPWHRLYPTPYELNAAGPHAPDLGAAAQVFLQRSHSLACRQVSITS